MIRPPRYSTLRLGALAMALLFMTPAAGLAQSGQPLLGFGGGFFPDYVDIDQSHRHAMAYVAYQFLPNWSIAGEVGVAFDDDRLFGSAAVLVRGILREDGLTPFVVMGPTLLGSGSTAILAVVGGGLQVPLDDSSLSLGVRVHTGDFDFSSAVAEILAQFEFPI